MSNILVPIDFSPASDKALQYALELMDKELDSLIVLHVYMPPVPDPEMPYELLSQVYDSTKEISEMHIQKLLDRLKNEYGATLKVKGKVVLGSAIEGILNESTLLQADLLVMGMRGQNKMLRKIMGTTATRVIQRTEIPVIVVPDTVSYTPIRRIAYASNLEVEDIMALDKVVELANNLKAEVRCVHIQTEGESLDTYKKELLEEAYRHDLSQRPISVDVFSNENIIQGLNAYVELHEIDLIVMLTHQRSIFHRILEGSSTYDMTFKSAVPVWVFQSDSKGLKSTSKKVQLDVG